MKPRSKAIYKETTSRRKTHRAKAIGGSLTQGLFVEKKKRVRVKSDQTKKRFLCKRDPKKQSSEEMGGWGKQKTFGPEDKGPR